MLWDLNLDAVKDRRKEFESYRERTSVRERESLSKRERETFKDHPMFVRV